MKTRQIDIREKEIMISRRDRGRQKDSGGKVKYFFTITYSKSYNKSYTNLNKIIHLNIFIN